MLAPLLIREKNLAALPHEGHLPERVGLLQIIALGAIITEVVAGSRQQALSAATLFPALLSIITVVSLWRLYFDQARSLPVLAARLSGQVGRLQAWLYGHLPFTLSAVMLGVGLGHGISSDGAQEAALQQQFVVWPLAGALLTLVFLRWNSRRSTGHSGLDRSMVAMLVTAALSAGLAFVDLDTVRLQLFVAALAIITAVIVATDPATRHLGEVEAAVGEHLAEVAQEEAEGESPSQQKQAEAGA